MWDTPYTCCNEKGKTIILSSHIFSSLQEVCDALHLIDDGEIKKTVESEDFELLENEMIDEGLKKKLTQIEFLLRNFGSP